MSAIGFTLDARFLDELAHRVASAVLEMQAREHRPLDRWLDVDGAADYLSTTPESIRALVKRRAIPSHKVGGRRLFSRAELDEWVRGEHE